MNLAWTPHPSSHRLVKFAVTWINRSSPQHHMTSSRIITFETTNSKKNLHPSMYVLRHNIWHVTERTADYNFWRFRPGGSIGTFENLQEGEEIPSWINFMQDNLYKSEYHDQWNEDPALRLKLEKKRKKLLP